MTNKTRLIDATRQFFNLLNGAHCTIEEFAQQLAEHNRDERQMGRWCENKDIEYNYGACRFVMWENDYANYVYKFDFDGQPACANEYRVYKAAKKFGLAHHFAWIGKLELDLPVTIYAMEYCEVGEDYTYYKLEEYFRQHNRDFEIETDCEDSVIEYLNMTISNEHVTVLRYFLDLVRVNDLHLGNWGWRRDTNELVMTDFGGYRNGPVGATPDELEEEEDTSYGAGRKIVHPYQYTVYDALYATF